MQMYKCKGRDTIKTLDGWELLYRRSCYMFGFVCEHGEFEQWASINLSLTEE